jgi:hypothetical protein
MKHVVSNVVDVPPLPMVERRRSPDRRAVWRGGRRDSDWVNRPPDAWARLESRQRKPGLLRRAASVLHLW